MELVFATICLIFILILVALIIVTIHYYRNGSVTKRWPLAKAQVVDSSVIESQMYLNNEPVSLYEGRVNYRYAVRDKVYSGDQIMLARFKSLSRDDAEIVTQKYKAGRKLQAHYNPEDPEIAILEAKHDSRFWIWFAISAAYGLGIMPFVLFSLFFALLVANSVTPQ